MHLSPNSLLIFDEAVKINEEKWREWEKRYAVLPTRVEVLNDQWTCRISDGEETPTTPSSVPTSRSGER